LTHHDESISLLDVTKRLQVLFEDDELRDIQRLARRQRMTTAEWVRRSLRAARDAEGGADVGQKLAAVRAAAVHAFPTGDIEAVLAEIERGYAGGSAPAPDRPRRR
jgi:hypothetical protein